MLELTLRYNLGKKVIRVPTSWKDVTIEQYIDYVERDDGEPLTRISIFTGIAVTDLERMTPKGLMSFMSLIRFCYNFDEILNLKPFAEAIHTIIGNKPVKLFIEANQAIDAVKKAGRHEIAAGPEIVKLYTGEDITGKPVLEVLPKVNFFLTALHFFLKDTSTLKANTRPKNLKQELKALRVTDSLEAFTPFPKDSRRTMTGFLSSLRRLFTSLIRTTARKGKLKRSSQKFTHGPNPNPGDI